MPVFLTCSYSEITTQDRSIWLTESETTAYTGFLSEKRKRDWLVGRWASKQLLQKYLNQELNMQIKLLDVEIEQGEHRQPLVKIHDKFRGDICISLSHCEGIGYAGLSRTADEGHIGVDVQKIRAVREGFVQRNLTSSERDQLKAQFSHNLVEGVMTYWAIKEAGYKALRPRFSITKRQLEVSLQRSGKAQVRALNDPHVLVDAQHERRKQMIFASAMAQATSSGS